MIPYGRQDVTDDDISAVVEVLQSDWLTQGPRVPEFEDTVASYCQAKHAIAVNSATSALHIACLALGVSKDDVVWTSPISFVASANCALYCGATVNFVDINPKSANLCADSLADKLATAKANNQLPKVLIVVHMGGASADMEKIHHLAAAHNIAIIEDASHAIGGKYQDNPVGSCQFSDICVFSFHPVKLITSGEGGIATTNNAELAKNMALYRSHGITKDPKELTTDSNSPWSYEQHCLGFNYRMTDLNAALGISQMKRLDTYVAKRNALVEQYLDALSNLPVTFQEVLPNCYSAYHLMIMQVAPEAGLSRESLFAQLRAEGIGVNVHYIPIHFQPYYKELGFKPGDFPNAESYYKHCISLPLYPNLSSTDFDKIIACIKHAFSAN